MGYRTYFTLTMEPELELVEKYIRKNEDNIYEINEPFESTWSNHEEDMLRISKMFPNILFELYGEGDESGDYWYKHFKNGLMQARYAEIVFPEFDPTQLGLESENRPTGKNTVFIIEYCEWIKEEYVSEYFLEKQIKSIKSSYESMQNWLSQNNNSEDMIKSQENSIWWWRVTEREIDGQDNPINTYYFNNELKIIENSPDEPEFNLNQNE